ncbi:hypothetical protein HNP46_001145 [Pseudomonas nitritireducens]|uniref:Uncharacterized protein n=1 Tax=Pseudomonas nitroreducens TaxID=46680 RepID=A0A7W7KGC6_PSENT|nr:hypothetical protein [Pseudomonas nitritireducens]
MTPLLNTTPEETSRPGTVHRGNTVCIWLPPT